MAFLIVIAAAPIGVVLGAIASGGTTIMFGFLSGVAVGCAFAGLPTMPSQMTPARRETEALKRIGAARAGAAQCVRVPRLVVAPTQTAAPASARTASIDLRHTRASVRAKAGNYWNPPNARPSTASPCSGRAMLQPKPPSLPRRRRLLWGVLIAAAALVGGFALRLLRDANRPVQ